VLYKFIYLLTYWAWANGSQGSTDLRFQQIYKIRKKEYSPITVFLVNITDRNEDKTNLKHKKYWQRTCFSCGMSVNSHFMMVMSRPPLNKLDPPRHSDWTPSEWVGSSEQRGLMTPAQSDGTLNTCSQAPTRPRVNCRLQISNQIKSFIYGWKTHT